MTETSHLAFGPYQLVRRLGSGGMAETFLAIRQGPGGFEQELCVKRILPAFEADPRLVEDFMTEAKLAAQLRHANITQVVDFGVVAGSHYLALELVDGMDLRALLHRLREAGERLEPAVAAHIGLGLASALDFAHRPGRHHGGVIHRDVSPSNTLLSRAGEVYLTDFGIARALGVKRRTDAGVIRGKIPYLAPEYALHGHFDARSDLFALGVLLYEALAGVRPFDGPDDVATLRNIRDARYTPIGERRPDAGKELIAIITALLANRPEDRPPNAVAVVDALARLNPGPTAARALGERVRGSVEPLARSLRITHASRTVALGVEPAPAYPEVRGAAPDAATRSAALDRTLIEATVDPERGLWAATDPDRPSEITPAPAPERAPALVVARATPASAGPVFIAVIALLGLLAFAAAGAAGYLVVDALRAFAESG